MSRASDLGVTPAKLRRATVSRLTRAKRLMEEVCGLWGDIDQAIVNDAETVIARLNEFDEALDQSFEILRGGWE